MPNPITAEARGWRCARSTDFADGYLLWMPLLLIALDDSPNFSSSLVAALALLLMAAVFWADGRGRAESWAETLFAFGWMGLWSAAGGLLLLDLGRGGDLGWLWGALCLAAGAAVLAWSWDRRRRRPLVQGPRPASWGADAMIWLGAGTVLLLLALASGSLLWLDAVVLGLTFVSYVVLTPRGRAARVCGALR